MLQVYEDLEGQIKDRDQVVNVLESDVSSEGKKTDKGHAKEHPPPWPHGTPMSNHRDL